MSELLHKLEALRAQLTDTSKPIEERAKTEIPFFDWNISLNDVSSQGGFDIVIGNPPYISYYSNTGSSLTQEERKILVNNFDVVAKANDRINTMNLMIERGLTLLRKRGHLSFIVNKTVAVLPSYISTRQHILDKSQIAYYVPELSPFAAIVDCIILGLNKDNGLIPYQSKLVNDSLTDSKEFCAKDFRSNRLLEFISPENADLLSKIEKCPKKLSDYMIVNRGVNIGGCFDDFLCDTQKNPLYRKYLPGTANVKKFGYTWSEDDGYMILDQALERRLKSIGKTIALGDPQRYDKERLIIPESSQTITAAYCNEPYYTGYGLMIGTRISNDYSLRFLCSILNSKLITFYAIKKEILRKGNKATPHVGTKGLLALPIPECSCEQQSKLEALVLSMEQQKKKDFNETNDALQRHIDILVYKLYKLTYDEVQIIDSELTNPENPNYLSEEDYNKM